MPPVTVSRIPVRYAETDRMGVVHHSVYPVYFEVGRTDFFAEHCVHYDEMERQGLFAVIIDYQVRLKERATYGDTLVLETRGDFLRGIRLQMSYRASRSRDGVLVADGITTLALVDSAGRPAHPRHYPDLYAAMAALLGPGPAS